MSGCRVKESLNQSPNHLVATCSRDAKPSPKVLGDTSQQQMHVVGLVGNAALIFHWCYVEIIKGNLACQDNIRSIIYRINKLLSAQIELSRIASPDYGLQSVWTK